MLVNKNIIGKKQYKIPYDQGYKYKLDVIQNYFESITFTNHIEKPNEYSYQDNRYDQLIELIAEYNYVPNDYILLTGGSDNALKTLLEAFLTPDSVLKIFTPTYPHFIAFAENMYRKDIIYEELLNGDVKDINLDNVNLCYLVSPNLPLGYVVNLGDLKFLLNKYKNIAFILDEAYIEYGGTSAANLIKYHNNLFITRTFSKAFGLAGMRIGYILTSNADLLKPLINDKNVTKYAIDMAYDVLKNVDHYRNQIKKAEKIKEKLRIIFKNIITEDSEIYNYNIKAGNFFLIYSRNPSRTYNIFKNHGILIRDKSSEIKDSLRICISTENVMNDVISIIKLINIKDFMNLKIIFDLDMTLRNGSKNTSKLYDGAQVLLKKDCCILTNNNITPLECYDYLFDNNIDFDINKLYTSLYFARQYIGDKKVYVYGNKTYFNTLVDKIEDCDLILLASVDISFKDVVQICEQLMKGKTLLYTDSSLSCSITNCSEIEYCSDVIIPDMGSIIKLFENIKYKPILIGKPSGVDLPGTLKDYSVMVGDSSSDEKLAKILNIPFIEINPEYFINTNQDLAYSFYSKKFIIKNISQLI